MWEHGLHILYHFPMFDTAIQELLFCVHVNPTLFLLHMYCKLIVFACTQLKHFKIHLIGQWSCTQDGHASFLKRKGCSIVYSSVFTYTLRAVLGAVTLVDHVIYLHSRVLCRYQNVQRRESLSTKLG